MFLDDKTKKKRGMKGKSAGVWSGVGVVVEMSCDGHLGKHRPDKRGGHLGMSSCTQGSLNKVVKLGGRWLSGG